MKKTIVYYACMNGGDGSVNLKWFLTRERADNEEESQSEGWGENCVGSVETFEGSDIHTEAVENSNKHEYLEQDKYYEVSSVVKGRSNKICEHCGKSIPIGMPHDVHKFYGEDRDWPTYPTHKICSKKFKESLN